MKLSFGKKVKTKKTILFACVENAGRSQMAEGICQKYAPEVFVSGRSATFDFLDSVFKLRVRMLCGAIFKVCLINANIY